MKYLKSKKTKNTHRKKKQENITFTVIVYLLMRFLQITSSLMYKQELKNPSTYHQGHLLFNCQ